ncbi:hypothetical protein FA13DRAFT_487925 [Coprinellus micaceus]|uniref:Uncharacterized protein n=1 Tax=Coprinellus micaceus TaxID=71717 RepID=A0A4Y7SC92_COPMI|nr:hypothetical protein FA13DRAFT_487925 [Coprinellus micaceus]
MFRPLRDVLASPFFSSTTAARRSLQFLLGWVIGTDRWLDRRAAVQVCSNFYPIPLSLSPLMTNESIFFVALAFGEPSRKRLSLRLPFPSTICPPWSSVQRRAPEGWRELHG